jgi:hypothetical protein
MSFVTSPFHLLCVKMTGMAMTLALWLAAECRSQTDDPDRIDLKERLESRLLRRHSFNLDVSARSLQAEKAYRFVDIDGWSYREIIIYQQKPDASFFRGKWIIFERDGSSATQVVSLPDEKVRRFLETYHRILPSGLKEVKEKNVVKSWGDDIGIISFQEWSETGTEAIFRSYSEPEEMGEMSTGLQALFEQTALKEKK